MPDRTDKVDYILDVDVTSGDFVPAESLRLCRAIRSDLGGKVKVRIRNYYTGEEKDVVIYLNPGVWDQTGNVVRVYRYLAGTTACESQIHNSANVDVNGIKLGF